MILPTHLSITIACGRSTSVVPMGDVLWAPDRDQIESTSLWRFMQSLPDPVETYEDLWTWSITERGAFWQAVWEHTGIVASREADRPIGREAMPGTEWFPGARLNYAENLLRRSDDTPAIIATAEGRDTRTITWRGLNRRVAAARRGLVAVGVESGDRVAALLPNCPEAIIGMLAAASIGALWSSCSPDFGAMGVVDRFGQIEPKVLIAADGYRYNGRVISLEATIGSVLDAIAPPDLVVIVDFSGTPLDLDREWVAWNDLEQGDDDRPEFAQLPFDHPLLIMYSSGTTGPPKSIVHSAGGVLIKHLSEQMLLSDVRPGDRVFWFTTCGWMMWRARSHPLRIESQVPVDLRRPGHRTACGGGSRCPAVGGLHRRSAQPRPIRLDLRSGERSGQHLICHGRHRPGRDLCRRRPHPPGAAGRDHGTLARHGGRCVRSRRPSPHRRTGRVGVHRSVAHHAGLLLERPRRVPVPGGLLRDVPGGVGSP